MSDNFTEFWTTNSVDYVVSHKDCADGALASWIIKRYGGKAFEASEYLFIKAGSIFEGPSVEGKTIMFLDNMPHNIEDIVQTASCVIVIDHHVHPNYEDFQALLFKYPQKIRGGVHGSGDKCASDLVWGFYQGTKPQPMFVKIVSTNDLWKWDSAPPEYRALWRYYFQGKTDVDFDQLMLKEDYSEEIKKGQQMVEEDERLIQEHMKRAVLRKVDYTREEYHSKLLVKTGEFLGYRKVYLLEGCPYAFISVIGSRLAQRDDCDFAAISNQEEKGTYSVSLRSFKNKADVGAFAAKLAVGDKERVIKGGGHPNAAGITLRCDPKELFTAIELTDLELNIQHYVAKAELRYYNEWNVYFLEQCPYDLVDDVGVALAKKPDCDFAAISNKDSKEYCLDLISFRKTDVFKIAEEITSSTPSTTEMHGNMYCVSILMDSNPSKIFWKEKHRVVVKGEQLYDQYKNKRSPTSIGCNNKFTWDRSTNKFDADIDESSTNFIYDKDHLRLRSLDIIVAVPSTGGITRATLNVPQFEEITNAEEDAPLPKHT